MYSIRSLFGSIINENTLNIFADATVSHCNLDSDNRKLCVSLECGSFVGSNAILSLREEIKTALKLTDITLNCKFDPLCFSADAARDIAHELCAKSVVLNGFFNSADFSFEENTVIINLKYGGYKRICESKFSEHLHRAISEKFGIDVEVRFEGQLEDVEIKRPEPEAVAPQMSAFKKADAPKPSEPEIKYDYKPRDGLPVYLESARLFYGRKINTDVIKLSRIVPPNGPDESVTIAAWGQVFGTDISVRDTKRGGKMAIAKFYFSDGTNSFSANLKKFYDAKYSKDMDKESKEFVDSISKDLRDGAYVIVNGEYSFDRWLNDFVVDVKALAALKKYEETDAHEGLRRVELHCHTNMSAKDAVSSAGDIINRAHKWGHRAVAITDHGVVQAYPAAADAVSKIRKSDPDFKVIYGVEGYYVDDINNELTRKRKECNFLTIDEYKEALESKLAD